MLFVFTIHVRDAPHEYYWYSALTLTMISAILGSEYCSGYIDAAGKWNTGFYCPSSDDNENIFCCGTPEDKFCCTKKDQVVQEEVEG